MNRSQIVKKLNELAPYLRRRGIKHAALFGSTARNETTAHSDIDIIVELDPSARLSGFDLVGIERVLAEHLHAEVHILTHPVNKPGLLAEIERDQIFAF
ncbi:MAG: nucleotidyltransferase domain-containing protein [Alphaproteobacteria bacterium]|nr:nucleotidyltransferase domain-containing protein [Alphaproteobacteria bacterium]